MAMKMQTRMFSYIAEFYTCQINLSFAKSFKNANVQLFLLQPRTALTLYNPNRGATVAPGYNNRIPGWQSEEGGVWGGEN